MLFDDRIRTDSSSAAGDESTFHFLSRSAWRRCGQVRKLLNEWSLPMAGDAEFISQLSSDDNKKHAAAVFELIIYTLLGKTGFEVVKHPPGTLLTTPDFRASHSSGFSGFVECTLSGNSFEKIDEEKRKKAVENIIQEIEYFPYFINLSFNVVSARSISKKGLVNFIRSLEAKSDGLSHEELFEMKHPFENNGWELEISLMRKSDPGIKGSLGMIMGSARAIDHIRPAMNALNDKKPARYGISDAPYIIALDNKDLFLKEEEFNEVLWGNNAPEKIHLDYGGLKGFFFADGRPVNTSVSAILFCKGLNILSLEQARISLWHNPFARFPVPSGIFPCDEYHYEAEGYVLTKRASAKDFDLLAALGVDKDEYLRDPK